MPASTTSQWSTLQRFPLSTTRFVRWPVYHTVRYGGSDEAFARTLDGLAAEGHPLSYALHAVDALGLEEDGVDARMARHPGVSESLPAKRDLLGRTLRAIAAAYHSLPYRERISER